MFAKYYSLFFYFLAACAQFFAALYAFRLFFKSKSYRLASGLLTLAFALMVGRRISPLLLFYYDGYYNIIDAVLAFIISVLILFGSIEIKKIFLDLEQKNLLLDKTVKTDSLTGALSRSETFSRAQLEIERSLRNMKPVAFLMLDIDHFKNINDQYGHPIGDIVLHSLVNFCREELRAIDIFGRVGGEEFFIVLPDNSDAQAFDVAERLRKKVQKSSMLEMGGKEIFISISIGVVSFDPLRNGAINSASILKDYFEMSDEAMYQAKAKGRNRTELCIQ